jgi:hypothetical protein
MSTTKSDKLLDPADAVVGLISFEFLLKTSLVVYAVSLLITQLGDPARGMTFSFSALVEAATGKMSWLGALFGAIYLALYTRFSSQWTYVANVYNQIKAAEAKAGTQDNKEALAQWKAGFIEDAQELHLATKGIFAGVIQAWLSDVEVKKQFVQHAPGGEDRLRALEEVVGEAYRMQASVYERRGQQKL